MIHCLKHLSFIRNIRCSSYSNEIITPNWRHHFLPKSNTFWFSKKNNHQQKKRTLAPRYEPKPQSSFMKGPQAYKQGINQAREMKTVAESNFEIESLREIILEQRVNLEASIKEETNPNITKNFFKVINLNRYYIRKPLLFMNNAFKLLTFLNASGLSILTYLQEYEKIGWWIGCVTEPSAITIVCMFLGVNMALNILRQALHLHLSKQKIPTTQISLISSTTTSILELTFLVAQMILVMNYWTSNQASSFFPVQLTFSFALTAAFTSLLINLTSICRASGHDVKLYMGTVSSLMLLAVILIGFYTNYKRKVQNAGKTIQDEDNFTEKETQEKISRGYKDFKAYFKHQKIILEKQSKINDWDK